MRIPAVIFALCAIAFAEPADQGRDFGSAHLTTLKAEPWLAEWQDAKLDDIRLVKQQEDQTWPTGLPAAWWAKVTRPDGATGYLAWDADKDGRLPHKPQLSWGHEVAGVGWARLGDVRFAGVLDNYFPTRNAATLRWIRADAFESLITIQPKASAKPVP